uniref:Uncharacterized protein n=1 Tax=uncultured bacterium W5-77b TaxID=1131000 RepID=H9BWG3_9BACT|nr:hypothetical protein [uncultured bacterium W5-77b]
MSFNFSSIGSNATKKNYMDFLRPAGMVDAKLIFKKIQITEGTSAADAFAIASEVKNAIKATTGSDLDQLWTRIESALNRKKPIKTAANTTAGKLNTTLGLLYSAMEVIDGEDDIRYVRGMRSLFLQSKQIVESRFLGRLEGSEKRSVQRSLDTIASYFDRVTKRFNKRVKKNEIAGPEIKL